MTEKEIQELVRDFNNRKDSIVPVIGEEVLCYVDDAHLNDNYAPDGSVVLQEYLVDYMFSNVDASDLTEEDVVLKNRMKDADWYYCLTLLEKRFVTNFENDFVDIMKDPHVKLTYEVGRFLEQNNFSMILTTLTTDVIERSIESKHYKALWYDIDWNPKDPYLHNQPTVFHLMGNSGEYAFVKNENELVEYLYNLLSTEHGPVAIYSELIKKALMMLGCELPDWVFRLLLYRMDKKVFDGKKKGFWFTDIMHNDSPHQDDKPISDGMTLSQLDFLNPRFPHLSDLKEILPKLTSGSDIIDSNQRHGYEYDIFLSYAGGDVDYKNAVTRELLRQCPQLKIWAAPERVKLGDNYWSRIQEGIRNSRYFMPLVSDEYIDKMLSPNQEHGEWLKKETNEAIAELKRRNEKLLVEDKPPLSIYSLPVFNPKAKFYNDKLHHMCSIDSGTIEKLADGNNPKLPPSLFLRLHMYEFNVKDENCTFRDNKWCRYKGEIE